MQSRAKCSSVRNILLLLRVSREDFMACWRATHVSAPKRLHSDCWRSVRTPIRRQQKLISITFLRLITRVIRNGTHKPQVLVDNSARVYNIDNDVPLYTYNFRTKPSRSPTQQFSRELYGRAPHVSPLRTFLVSFLPQDSRDHHKCVDFFGLKSKLCLPVYILQRSRTNSVQKSLYNTICVPILIVTRKVRPNNIFVTIFFFNGTLCKSGTFTDGIADVPITRQAIK